MSEGSTQITLKKALIVFLLFAVLLTGAGFTIGELFFWNSHPVVNTADVDITYLEKLLVQDPRNDKLMVELGWQYYQKGNYQKAIKLLSQAITLNKQNPAAHFNLGVAYEKAGLLAKAEAEYLQTLRLDQESKYAYYALGKLYLTQGKYDPAITQLKLATEKDAVSVDNYFLLGQAYEKKGFKAEAKAAYGKVLTMVPDHKEAKEGYYRLK